MRFTPKRLTVWAALSYCANAYSLLSDTTLKSLPAVLDADFNIHNQEGLLAPILIPRVPGTPGSAKVREHFADFFQRYLPDWQITYQNSTSQKPTSNGEQIPFINVIATRDPPWIKTAGDVGRLALVAHYDSLQNPQGFIGAIDSAAPCAMLLHVARAIDEGLTKKWEAMSASGASELDLEDSKGVQLLLLDGEEAFLMWSATDSIYGARALADEWEATVYPAMSAYRNPLESLELFVLLDLLGASEPQIPSYFKTTHWAYKNLAHIESRLRTAGRLRTKPKQPFLPESEKKDTDKWIGGKIGDDHVPFLAKGVEILHLIPSDFPHVWHNIKDDGEHLDIDTVIDWATLTTAFAAEWLELDGYFTGSKQTNPRGIMSEKSELESW